MKRTTKYFLIYIFVSLIALVGLYATTAYATQLNPLPVDSCKPQAPYGFPKYEKDGTSIICRNAYVLEHDNKAKIPMWVSYVLTPEHTEGCVKRTDKFSPDFSLEKGQRAELGDYLRSGYDRGHIANDADMTWSKQTEEESLILSNMTPQLHGLNAGIWKTLEEATRSWAYNRKHSILIYAGPIYDIKTAHTIGRDKVVIPRAFYKIVTDTKTGESLAFIFPHEDIDSNDLSLFQTTVDNVEDITKIKFDIIGDKHAKLKIWNIDLKPVSYAKKELCNK